MSAIEGKHFMPYPPKGDEADGSDKKTDTGKPVGVSQDGEAVLLDATPPAAPDIDDLVRAESDLGAGVIDVGMGLPKATQLDLWDGKPPVLDRMVKGEAVSEEELRTLETQHLIMTRDMLRLILDGVMEEIDLTEMAKLGTNHERICEELFARTRAGIEKAKTIMGPENVRGMNLMREAFGVELTAENCPALDVDEETLQRNKELGHILKLGLDEVSGRKLNILELGRIFGVSFRDQKGERGRIWTNDTKLLEGAPSLKEIIPRLGWSFMSEVVLPDSIGKNYFEQADIIVEYLEEEAFAGIEVPQVYQRAIQQYRGERESISRLMESDDPKDIALAAKKLEGLEINKLCRHNVAEAVLDILLARKRNQDMFRDICTCTSSPALVASFLGVGGTGQSNVIAVVPIDPRYHNSRLGTSIVLWNSK